MDLKKMGCECVWITLIWWRTQGSYGLLWDCVDNINMVKDTGSHGLLWQCVDNINMVKDKGQSWVVVNKLMDLQAP
jgi:hypothetical protein